MKHFLLAMATLWCVASTFSSFAADNNKWKPLFGKNLENANYNPEVWSETDGVLGAVKDESIWTKDEYENFELDLDFKTDVGIAAHEEITELLSQTRRIGSPTR